MADETYYAWSKFDVERNEWGQAVKQVMPGEKITQDMLKVSDEEWDELKKVGAVRTEEYPDIPADTPPAALPKSTEEQIVEINELSGTPPGTGSPPDVTATGEPTGEKTGDQTPPPPQTSGSGTPPPVITPAGQSSGNEPKK